MPETYLTIPKSLFYYLDNDNQNSLNILNEQETPPPSFSLEEVIDFYKAKASLEACKYEFYDFMTKFYQATWGQALKESEGIIKPSRYQYHTKSGLSPSIITVWEGFGFAWPYRIPQNRNNLYLGVCIYEGLTLLGIYCFASVPGNTPAEDYQLNQTKCENLDDHWELGPKNDPYFYLNENFCFTLSKEKPKVSVDAKFVGIAIKALKAML